MFAHVRAYAIRPYIFSAENGWVVVVHDMLFIGVMGIIFVVYRLYYGDFELISSFDRHIRS